MSHFGYTSLGFGSGTSAAAPPPAPGFNIDVFALEATILASTGDATGVIAFATDTSDLYVFDGTRWQIYQNS